VNLFYNYHNTERETSSGSLNSLRILSLNCCSLRSQAKRGIFNAIIDEQKPDIVLGCESHLDSSYNSSEIFPVGFTVIRKERVGGRGGGVFILFKQLRLTIIRRTIGS